MKVVSFLNKKGGAGKTTTAIGVAMGFRRRGLRVGLIDTDPNGSASRWMETVPDLDSVPCGARDLASLLEGVRGDYDIIVVDSPPNDVGAISSIAAVSDVVVVPLAPSTIEVDQLADTVELFDAEKWMVVPVRVRMSTTAGKTIRELCQTYGVPATKAIVPLSEAISKAFGEELPWLSYSPLVDELLDEVGLVPA